MYVCLASVWIRPNKKLQYNSCTTLWRQLTCTPVLCCNSVVCSMCVRSSYDAVYDVIVT